MYRSSSLRSAFMVTAAVLAISGCKRQVAPPGLAQPTPSPAGSPAVQVSPDAGEAMKKEGEGVMKKGIVSFLSLRAKVIAGQPLEVVWQVSPPEAKKIPHTAFHYDTVSHPGDFGTDVTADAASYKELTGEFAKGEFLVPRAFRAKLTPNVGTLYVRAHALIDGMNYWTAEELVEVVAEPSAIGEGEGAMKKEGEVKTVTMTAKQWTFEPAEVRVKKGDRVKLEITSVDVAHGFGLPDFNVNQKLEPGKTVTVEFTADKTGTFTYFCSVQCGTGHREMKGKLIVE